LFAVFAESVGLFFKDKELLRDMGRKVISVDSTASPCIQQQYTAIESIIIGLIWVSRAKMQKIHFLELLAGQVSQDQLMDNLDSCSFGVKGVDNQFITESPTTITLPGKTESIVLRPVGFRQYCAVEYDGELAGFVAIEADNFSANSLTEVKVDIQILQDYVKQDIGAAVISWIADQVGPDKIIVFAFPTCAAQVKLFSRCQREGVFDLVEAGLSSGRRYLFSRYLPGQKRP
jgi:hypothetical protein